MPTATRKSQLKTPQPLQKQNIPTSTSSKRSSRRALPPLLSIFPILCIVLLLVRMIFFPFIDEFSNATTLPPPPLLSYRQPEVCNQVQHSNDRHDQLWKQLCVLNFTQQMDQTIYQSNNKVNIVQIGAHTGFDLNDPLAQGMVSYLELLNDNQKQQVVWTFVEPSPPNFARLQENIHNHTSSNKLCQLKTVQAAVVSDALPDEDIASLTFYGIRDTIDPESGFDSLSGKQLPSWVTQISSFSEEVIMKHWWIWTKQGLNISDYMVKTKVHAVRYSDLMETHIDATSPPLLTLIDTEGFDCNIILGMSSTSKFLSHFIVYEHKHCTEAVKEPAKQHLERMNYTVVSLGIENNFAYRQP